MRKIAVLILAMVLLLVGCDSSGIAQEEYDALKAEQEELQNEYDKLKENYDSLAKTWEEIQPGYQEYLNQKANDGIELIGIQSWADCISKENFICTIDEDSVLVILYPDGQTQDEIIDTFSDFAGLLPSLIRSGEFSSVIIAVLDDTDDVWFGWSVKSDGEATSFLNSDFT